MPDDNVVTLGEVQAEQKRARLGMTKPAELMHDAAIQMKIAGNFVAANIALRRAVTMCPDSGTLWASLGSGLWHVGKYDEAYDCLQRALELQPDDLLTVMYMGMMLSSMQRKEEAFEYLRRAIDANPNETDPHVVEGRKLHARWSLALAQLDHGDWLEGFKEYECRYAFRGREYYPKLPYPFWQGEDLNGKTLFIEGEQGVGDRILFSRYLAWVCDTWPKATVLVHISAMDQPISLEGLLWGFCERYPNLQFLPHGIPFPKADYCLFLMSLARIHGTTPSNVPPDPGLIRERAMREAHAISLPQPHVDAIKVGISWAGNPAMTRNPERSIWPEMMFELEQDPLVQLYSLQFGDNGLARLGAGQIIPDCAADIGSRGMLGTAVVMLNLDLIITVCTSNAHLAGALGVPCWTLLHYDPYWMWLRGRDDAVWYPSMKLFRQGAPGDWRGVIERVKRELHVYAEIELLKRRKEKDSKHG